MFRWLRRAFCGIPEEQIARFCKGRAAQLDEHFLRDAQLATDPETVRIALAVRRAVARIGSIDPQYIQPGDVYPDQLAILPLWDSMDWMAFVWELEEQLGTQLSDDERDRVITADRFSVKEVAENVRSVLAGRTSA